NGKQKHQTSLSNITKAELVEVEKDDVVKARAVWKLSDNDGNILGYLKYGNTQEIENTFLVDKVMKENNLKEKYPLLEIEYPEIITLGVTSLPDDVLQKVNEDFERIKKDVRDVNSRAQIGFILSPINSNGFFWAKRHLSPATALLARTKLNDEPITVEEWKQVNAFFSTLNQKGFVHEDLFNNLFFSRNAEGKLVLGLLDFESVRKSNNVEDLMTMKVFFEDIGAKEKGNKPKKVSAFDKILASLAETENVPSKNLMVGKQAVWRLKNTQGNIIAYLKYGTEEEIAKTRLLQKIISRNNFAKKYPLVDIEFPQIVAEKVRLPEQFQKNIDMELSGIRSALWGDDRGQIPFVMSPINTDGFTYYEALKASNKPIIKEKLLGKEITEEEWEQIREIFMELNDQGFVHPDLFNNFYIRRNENGKISLSMLDFEKTYQSVPENIFEIDLFGKALNKIGLIKAQGNYDSLLANVAQAKLVSVNDDIVEARAVWELKDKGGKTIGYLKYGMVEEINRTKL
ncbi:MAG: hypothetical protein II183_03600, partial [Elusimicrobiaceae bacterium]|nr:hypothetical protein [Elusimicrobiaceae bacterium]